MHTVTAGTDLEEQIENLDFVAHIDSRSFSATRYLDG
jgi:hypothetical protein